MSSCQFFNEYVARQKEELTLAVRQNRWYLSQRANHDVGEEAAVRDFCERHLEYFARSFRVRFCRHVCPLSDTCELGQSTVRRDALMPAPCRASA